MNGRSRCASHPRPPPCPRGRHWGPRSVPNIENLGRSILTPSPLPSCPIPPPVVSAELYHSLKVSDRGQNLPKLAQNGSESLCAAWWAPCRIFWARFGTAPGPNPIRNRRYQAGVLQFAWGPFSSAEVVGGSICLPRRPRPGRPRPWSEAPPPVGRGRRVLLIASTCRCLRRTKITIFIQTLQHYISPDA